MFGSGARDLEETVTRLERQNREMKEFIHRHGLADVAVLDQRVQHAKSAAAAEMSRLEADVRLARSQAEQEVSGIRAAVRRERSEAAQQEALLADLRKAVVEVDERRLLQEAGFYQFRHRLADAAAYKRSLDALQSQMKAQIKAGVAVRSATSWTVDGSASKGAKMAKDLGKLMLRAYNSEADALVRTMRPYSLDAALTRLGASRDTIARLGSIMGLEVDPLYHSLRCQELELTSDYLVKVEEEKEAVRAAREEQRERDAADKEMQAAKERLAKERRHYESVLERLRSDPTSDAQRAELGGKIAEIEQAITGIEQREANIRTGYVYVISNVGAFGDHMVKIGLTRRLEPMDRVRELGDASVPFPFDVHALVFSEDAVSLETALHQRFADRKVNLVNPRREFFYVTPADVREALMDMDQRYVLNYRELPEACQWRESGGDRRLS